jgi:hypothetical protein
VEQKLSCFLLHSEPSAAVAKADPQTRHRQKSTEGLKMCQGCGHLFLNFFEFFFDRVIQTAIPSAASAASVSQPRQTSRVYLDYRQVLYVFLD